MQSRNQREGRYAGKARKYFDAGDGIVYIAAKHFRVGNTSYASLKETAAFYKRIGI